MFHWSERHVPRPVFLDAAKGFQLVRANFQQLCTKKRTTVVHRSVVAGARCQATGAYFANGRETEPSRSHVCARSLQASVCAVCLQGRGNGFTRVLRSVLGRVGQNYLTDPYFGLSTSRPNFNFCLSGLEAVRGIHEHIPDPTNVAAFCTLANQSPDRPDML